MAGTSIALTRLEEQKVSLDGLAILRETHTHPLKLEEVPELAQLVVKSLSRVPPVPSRIEPKLFSSQELFTLRSALWAAVGWLPLTKLTPDILGYRETHRHSLVVAGPEKGMFGKPWNRVGFFTLHVENQETHASVLVVPLVVWQMAEELVERALPPILPHYAWDEYAVYNLDWREPCTGARHERFLGGLSPREAKVIGGLLNGWYPDTPGCAGVYPHALPSQWVEKLVAVGKELARGTLPSTLSWECRRDTGLLYARRIPFVLETREKHLEYRRITDLQTTPAGSLVSIEVTPCDPQGETSEKSPVSYTPPPSPPGCDHSEVSEEDIRCCVACEREVCEECGYICEECENWLCEDCRTECEGCGATLCDRCSCETCFECESCGGVYREGNCRGCDGCERSPLCPQCAEECCPCCLGCGEQTREENLGSCPHCARTELCKECWERCPCQDQRG